jgi:hypothetical protein
MPELNLNHPMEQNFLRKHKLNTIVIIQPEPAEHLVSWMEDQGYKVGYRKNNWRCVIDDSGVYSFSFSNEEIMSAFLLRWM